MVSELDGITITEFLKDSGDESSSFPVIVACRSRDPYHTGFFDGRNLCVIGKWICVAFRTSDTTLAS